MPTKQIGILAVMAVVSKRVAAHVIRKPVVEAIPEAVPEMQAAHETTRVDIRELQHMLTSTAPPVDLETDIEVCAEPARSTPPDSHSAVLPRRGEPGSSTRLAHTVRRADSIADASELEVAPARDVAPAATVEMQAIQIEAAHAAGDDDRQTVAAPRRDRATLYAAAAFVVAAISLVAVVASM